MTKYLYRFPLFNLGLIVLITGVLGYGLTLLGIESDISQMLPRDNPVYQEDLGLKAIYGNNEALFIGIKSKNGEILSVENIKTIAALTDRIETIKLPQAQTDKQPEEIPGQDTDDALNSLLEDFETGIAANILTEPGHITSDNTRVIEQVKSITNLEIVEGVNGGLEPVSLAELIPTNGQELKLFKAKLLSWSIFQGMYYSRDLSAASITVHFTMHTDDYAKSYVYEKVRELVLQVNNTDLEFYIAGKPVVTGILSKYISRDLRILVPFVILVLSLVLFLSFKNLKGVLLPLLTVVIATIWTLGLMGYLGIKLSTIGVLIPVLLIAIGSAYGIHIIAHYLEDNKHDNPVTKAEHKAVVLKTVKHVIFPVFLAALTTFIGFFSLITMKIMSIKEFGIFISIGVTFELILSVLFIPSVILLLKPDVKKLQAEQKRHALLERLLFRLAKQLKAKKVLILILFGFFIAILVNGALRIKANFDNLKFFRQDSQIIRSTHFIDRYFAGSDTIFINIAGEKAGDLTYPLVLQKMDELAAYLIEKYENIGKVIGFNDMIKRMNQVMHYPGEKYYEIPLEPDKYGISNSDLEKLAREKGTDLQTLTIEKKNELKQEILKQLISQYLILYSGNLDEVIATDQLRPEMAKLTVMIKQTRSEVLELMIADIKEYIKVHFPQNYKVQMGGTTMLTNELNNIVISGQILSFIFAILIVFIVVALAFRSAVAGLISTIPIITSILINFALMGYFNIDLNIATALLASLSIGIGIDYTIHFLAFYKVHWRKLRNTEQAIEQAFAVSGKAIIYNALSVGLGFAALLFSSTELISTFGILITIVMFSTSLGAITLIPVILEIFKPGFVEK